MNKLHQHPNYACERSTIMPWTSSRRSTRYDPSSPPSMNLRNTKAHPQTNSMPLSERTSPCLISTTPLAGSQPHEELDMREDPGRYMKMKTLLQRMEQRDPELCLLLPRGHPKSEPLMSHSSPGLCVNRPRTVFSPPAKILRGKWSKITPSISNSRNSEFSAPNEYLNFLTWNGTMSSLGSPSTSTSSSLGCTPPRLTAGPLKTSANSNFTLGPLNQLNPSRPMETGSSHGESLSERPNSYSHIAKRNSRNILSTFPHTSHLCTPVPIGKSLNSIRRSGSESDLSTTSRLTSSTSSVISKLAISTDTAPVKAVLSPNRKRARDPELELVGDKLTHAAYGTMENARRKRPRASTDTFARPAEDHTAKMTVPETKSEALERRGHRPRFARQLIWDPDEEVIGPTAMYSLTAEPLPRPPPSAFTEIALKTISENSHLFKITCLIHVDVLENLLVDHPNPLFCQSVLTGLRKGFWPWPDKPDEYPETHDNSHRPPKTDQERAFLSSQVLSEQRAGRLSAPFGPDLLPGMYSPPVHAIPKPSSEKLRMVVDHSAGKYSLNSMIDPKDIAGVKLDGIKSLGSSLRSFRSKNPDSELVVFKSDVSAAYRQLPMHFLYQLLTIITVDNERRVDRCNNFGNRSAQKIWQSFMSLVIWILVFKRGLKHLKCYTDDAFSFSIAGNLKFYSPYQRWMPAEQASVLCLWDEIGLPHEDAKQIAGSVIPCIGFDVDPNRMTVTMIPAKRESLIDACELFVTAGRRPLRDFQRLTGHINWALNVYPRMRPALSALYAKIAGKSRAFASIRVNNDIRRELAWFTTHIKAFNGIHFLKSVVWSPHDTAHTTMVAYTDASSKGIGVWFPGEHVGYQCPLPLNAPKDAIFFFEALAVCSAILLARSFRKTTRLIVYTDNTNTFDIFTSLAAKPVYNRILMSSIDMLIEDEIDLRVFHIPGKDNLIADPLSRYKNRLATLLSPGLIIGTFIPPQDALGAPKK